jgi:hypothetical protein
VAVEQALGNNQRISATYTASLGRRLIRQNMLNSTFLPVNPIFTQLYLTDNSAPGRRLRAIYISSSGSAQTRLLAVTCSQGAWGG